MNVNLYEHLTELPAGIHALYGVPNSKSQKETEVLRMHKFIMHNFVKLFLGLEIST